VDYIELRGDHPWAGQRGQLVPGDRPGMVKMQTIPGGQRLFLVQLDNGVQTYAAKGDIILWSGEQRFTYEGGVGDGVAQAPGSA